MSKNRKNTSGSPRRAAIITGASSGIGRAVALGLAGDGYSVSLIARSLPQLDSLALEIVSTYSPVDAPLIFPIDVTDEKAVENAAAETARKFGCIDLLFNSAGVHIRGSWEIAHADFDFQISVNLRGAFNAVRAVVPVMKKQGSGYIINVASRRGKIAEPAEGAYSASKFAVVGMSEALYKELAPQGIKVTALCPGWVHTPMAHGGPIAEDEMIDTEDLVETVRYLLRLSPPACVKEILLEPRSNLS